MLLRNFCTVAVICFFILGLEKNVYGQDESTNQKIGLSGAIQGQQLDINVPVWLSPKHVLAPSLSFIMVEDMGSDLGLGAVMRFYLNRNKVSSYFAIRGGTFIGLPKKGDITIDLFFGPAFGGEYFFDKHFSIGAEAQLNASVSDNKSMRFNNPGGLNLNTGTSLFATIYF